MGDGTALSGVPALRGERRPRVPSGEERAQGTRAGKRRDSAWGRGWAGAEGREFPSEPSQPCPGRSCPVPAVSRPEPFLIALLLNWAIRPLAIATGLVVSQTALRVLVRVPGSFVMLREEF